VIGVKPRLRIEIPSTVKCLGNLWKRNRVNLYSEMNLLHTRKRVAVRNADSEQLSNTVLLLPYLPYYARDLKNGRWRHNYFVVLFASIVSRTSGEPRA
jgi:hypothetical protein